MKNAKKRQKNVFQQNRKFEPSGGKKIQLDWLLGAKIFNFDWLGVGVNKS